MDRRIGGLLALGLLTIGFLASESTAQAQYYQPYHQSYQLNRLFYYPYYYFPHNYWPATGPKIIEAISSTRMPSSGRFLIIAGRVG